MLNLIPLPFPYHFMPQFGIASAQALQPGQTFFWTQSQRSLPHRATAPQHSEVHMSATPFTRKPPILVLHLVHLCLGCASGATLILFAALRYRISIPLSGNSSDSPTGLLSLCSCAALPLLWHVDSCGVGRPVPGCWRRQDLAGKRQKSHREEWWLKYCEYFWMHKRMPSCCIPCFLSF